MYLGNIYLSCMQECWENSLRTFVVRSCPKYHSLYLCTSALSSSLCYVCLLPQTFSLHFYFIIYIMLCVPPTDFIFYHCHLHYVMCASHSLYVLSLSSTLCYVCLSQLGSWLPFFTFLFSFPLLSLSSSSSEYQLAKPSDSHRKEMLFGSLAKQGHPMGKFCWGEFVNKITGDKYYTRAPWVCSRCFAQQEQMRIHEIGTNYLSCVLTLCFPLSFWLLLIDRTFWFCGIIR